MFLSLSRFDETIDDLRMMYEVKERKILHKKQVYADLHEKLNVRFALNPFNKKFLVQMGKFVNFVVIVCTILSRIH